jgi:hypothetical protein
LKQPLDYMPSGHRRVRKAWPLYALILAVAGTAHYVAWRHLPEIRDILTNPILLAIGALLFGLVVYSGWIGDKWEYTIEGRTLSIRRPDDQGWATMQIDEIVVIVPVSEPKMDYWMYQFVFPSGRYVCFEASMFGPQEQFLCALRSIRPGLEIQSAKPGICHACGRQLSVFMQWPCKTCGAAAPREFPPVPTGGVLLPEGLALLGR